MSGLYKLLYAVFKALILPDMPYNIFERICLKPDVPELLTLSVIPLLIDEAYESLLDTIDQLRVFFAYFIFIFVHWLLD